MQGNDLFTRDEVISGLPAKRANTVLYLIESRTALLDAKSRREMEKFLTENAEKERDMAYLDSFASGKPPPRKPTIQDLERFAPHWADLVPENPRIRASLAHALAQKYALPKRQTPRLQLATGLNTPAVQRVFQELYHQPLETIYSTRTPLLSGLSWAWADFNKWLETANPFWTAFALTLTETVGAGILALPIVVAEIGPLAGVVLLVILGLVNILTIAAMAESATRSLQVRYGKAYFGLMVEKYLGSIGSSVITGSLAILFIVILFAYYYGFSTTLAAVTHIPAPVWAAGLFIICLYYVKRETLNATVASALVVGAISIGLILMLSILSARHVQVQNLVYMNLSFLKGPHANLAPLGIIFGVILAAYFGHTSVGNCANVVLHRDPSGRSLILGSIAGQLAAMIIYVIWVLAVNGAVGPQALANQAGTAIVPLASRVGSLVNIIGVIYVIFAIGMSSIHNSLGLYNLVRERLPQSGLWNKNLRFGTSIIPLAGIFMISEWALVTHTGSFSQPIGFLGIIVISLLAGVFPILLLVSSRKKGEIQPGFLLPGLDIPLITTGIYIIFIANLFVHGLLVWRNSLQGAAALLIGCLTIGVTLIFIKRGAFLPRLLLEIRSDQFKAGKTNFSITSSGEPIIADVRIDSPGNVRVLQSSVGEIATPRVVQAAAFHIPSNNAWDLEVLAYRLGKGGLFESLKGRLQIQTDGRSESYDLNGLKGEALTVIHGKACQVIYLPVHDQPGESYASI